jgi:hypothetical protein
LNLVTGFKEAERHQNVNKVKQAPSLFLFAEKHFVSDCASLESHRKNVRNHYHPQRTLVTSYTA